MSKDILDKLELKNKENLSSHVFNNSVTLGMNTDIKDSKINDDVSNGDIINNGIIDGVGYCKDEEKELTEDENINVVDLPIFPNLSE